MATIIAPFTAVDGNGHVRANAKLYFYMTGTSTPQNTFTDAALSVTATNPVVADSDGLFTAMYLGDPPDFAAYKVILKDSNDVTIYTVDPFAGAPVTTPISSSLLRGYLSGLQRTGSTGTTYSQGAGVATDDGNEVVMSLVSGTINAATVGADGLDAGSLTATATFHAFAIGKTDGTTARLLSASPTSPTMPSGYTYKRRTASLKTTVSSQIITHLQTGDYFALTAPLLEFNVTSSGTSAVTRTLTGVPTGILVEPLLSITLDIGAGSGSETVYLSSLSQTDVAADGTTSQVGVATQVGAQQAIGMVKGVITNTSGQIRSRQTTGNSGQQVRLKTHGWFDRRGRDD
jgi:hypothetical protein